jgi:hypothetical protein
VSVKHRVKKLEKAGYGAKPPLAVVVQEYIDRVRINKMGKPEEFVDAGPTQFAVPDGPLCPGKELHIEATELMEEFRGRIRKAYLDAWGCEHRWVEVSPEAAGL